MRKAQRHKCGFEVIAPRPMHLASTDTPETIVILYGFLNSSLPNALSAASNFTTLPKQFL